MAGLGHSCGAGSDRGSCQGRAVVEGYSSVGRGSRLRGRGRFGAVKVRRAAAKGLLLVSAIETAGHDGLSPSLPRSGGEGRGEQASPLHKSEDTSDLRLCHFSLRLSPRSFLAGRERRCLEELTLTSNRTLFSLADCFRSVVLAWKTGVSGHRCGVNAGRNWLSAAKNVKHWAIDE